MARKYNRNKLGQFSKGGATSRSNKDQTVSKGSIPATAGDAAIKNIAARSSSKSSGKGTSSISIDALKDIPEGGFPTFRSKS